MDLTTLPLVSTLLDLTYTGLLALTTVLDPVAGPLSAALAVVLVTLVLAAGAADPVAWLVFGCLVFAIASVGELSRRLLRILPPEQAGGPGTPRVPVGLLGLLQFATAVVALFVPLAAGLYLLVTVAWTLGQRLVLRRILPPAT